jgi:sporadic carbohydrate cluster 2OG-Fe(II) oxygenase
MMGIPDATLPFLRPDEAAVAQRFLTDGYVRAPVENPAALDRIRDAVAAAACRHLSLPLPLRAQDFLDQIHTHIDPVRLNDFRLAVFDEINAADWLRAAYFGLARQLIETIVGNELAMQRRVNLSVQLPGDDSSLLPIHSDTWSGDSPFEVVLWVPLVDCYRTKTMYFVPPAATQRLQGELASYETRGVEALYRAVEADLLWLDVPAGQVLLFNQNCAHGNRVNEEATTRWTLNCRFKGVFTPYADKKLGEFFEPITLRPASRIGLDYTLPGGFDDEG